MTLREGCNSGQPPGGHRLDDPDTPASAAQDGIDLGEGYAASNVASDLASTEQYKLVDKGHSVDMQELYKFSMKNTTELLEKKFVYKEDDVNVNDSKTVLATVCIDTVECTESGLLEQKWRKIQMQYNTCLNILIVLLIRLIEVMC